MPPDDRSVFMRVGVEVGGTFTDLVAVEGGRVVVTKVPSTPRSPGHRRVRGTHRLGHRPRAHRGSRPRLDGRHQRRAGAQGRVGGLRRHRGLSRPAVHAAPRPAQHLRPLLCQARAAGAPQGLLRGVGAARAPTARSRRRSTKPRSRNALIPALKAGGYRAVAICLLNAYANPAHEKRLAALIAEALPGVLVTVEPPGGARVPRVRARLDDAAVGLRPAGDRRLPAPLREQAGGARASRAASR